MDFKCLIQIKKEYVVYSTSSCVSDIGGNLGLLLGISILTIYDEAVRKAVQLRKKVAGKAGKANKNNKRKK